MINSEKFKFLLSGVSKTRLLGAVFASVCIKGCVIYLYGDVGVGKSVFCKGFLRALGYVGPVISPTYTLIESYVVNNWCIHHFDFYRLNSSEEMENIGFRDFFDGHSICLIEWPKQDMKILPEADIIIIMNYYNVNINVRQIIIKFFNNIGQDMQKSLFLSWDLFK